MSAPSRPLNVLFPYTGTSFGGSHMSSLLLARALEDKGHKITIGLHQPASALVSVLEEQGWSWDTLPDIPAPKLRALWRQWRARRTARHHLAPWLARNRIDIVHSHDMRNHLLWSAATDGGLVPHVWHQRTPAPGRHMSTWGMRAAAFIAVSHFTRDSLPAPLRGAAEMIYNPFLPQEPASAQARAAICAELGIAAGTEVVGYVSNFSDRKRPVAFVEIAAAMRRQRPDAPLAFAMFGAPNQPHLDHVRARAAELDIARDLHIAGVKTPFGPTMAGLSLLVAPARHEALGRTLIEAGFAGVPVVATDEGGNPEIIENGVTGDLIAPDNLAGYAQAALSILNDTARSKARVTAARRRVEARFSLAAHVAAVEEVYARHTSG